MERLNKKLRVRLLKEMYKLDLAKIKSDITTGKEFDERLKPFKENDILEQALGLMNVEQLNNLIFNLEMGKDE